MARDTNNKCDIGAIQRTQSTQYCPVEARHKSKIKANRDCLAKVPKGSLRCLSSLSRSITRPRELGEFAANVMIDIIVGNLSRDDAKAMIGYALILTKAIQMRYDYFYKGNDNIDGIGTLGPPETVR